MTNSKKFIIGSRGSKLSLAYSNHVKNLLTKSNSQFDNNSIEIKIIKTSGDIFQNKRISEIGGKGVFCKQIEEELLDSKINLAIHSLKDLPTQMTEGLCVNAVVKEMIQEMLFYVIQENLLMTLNHNQKLELVLLEDMPN